MPHKCTKCGREYKDGSTEILKGCASCGGKKFLYVKDTEINKDVLEEKSIEEIAEEIFVGIPDLSVGIGEPVQYFVG